MKFLKDQGYGGVIIWSLDLDDKTGDVCREGPFPIFNAAKRELSILPDHLANPIKKCLDDNYTLSSEFHSQSSKNEIHIFLLFILPGVVNKFSIS